MEVVRDCAIHNYCFCPCYKSKISNETTCQFAVTQCRIAVRFKALHATALANEMSSYWYILRAGVIFFACFQLIQFKVKLLPTMLDLSTSMSRKSHW